MRGLKWKNRSQDLEKIESHPARGAWIEIVRNGAIVDQYSSHPARGAWIEITSHSRRSPRRRSRTPHGVRGLKLILFVLLTAHRRSHPARGAWIEICAVHCWPPAGIRRTPHGVRGLKYVRRTYKDILSSSRTPHGVRGLKSDPEFDGSAFAGRTPHGVRGLK